MTELSFLIDLLLNHDLKKETKDAVAMRIKDVEEQLVKSSFLPRPMPSPYQLGTIANADGFIHEMKQAPSTLALMAKHGDIPPQPIPQAAPAPPPVKEIAQTAETVAAMQARQESINAALSGKVDKVAGRPRKW